MRSLSTVLVLSLALGAAASERDSELVAGIAAVRAKDYTSAIGTLSQVVRRLGPDPAYKDDLVAAYFHLGVAFAGLGQESPARSQFAQALQRKPDLHFEVKDAPDLAKKLFTEAQREAAPAIAAAAQQKRKPSKAPLLLAGAAAVGAGAAVVASAGGSSSATTGPPPSLGSVEPTRFFNFAGISGRPFFSLQSGIPGSGSTVSLATTRPRFVFRADSSPQAYPQVKLRVSLDTPDRGPCWIAESSLFALLALGSIEVVVEAFGAPQCAAPFTTLAVSVRLVNLETGQVVSQSDFTGGYKVVP